MLPTVRITRCGHQSDNLIIISSSSKGINMRLADSALVLSVSSSSWCGCGFAAVCDCGTPWTFLLPFFFFFFFCGRGGGGGGEIFRNPDPDLCAPGSASPRTLKGVVASLFHFRIVYTPPAPISIHFRKFSARQLSKIMIVKRVNYFSAHKKQNAVWQG